MSTVGKVLLGIFAFVLLIGAGFLIKIIWFPVHTTSKGIDTAYEVVDQTLTGENAIYNYEWFKRQEEGIRALYNKEERAKEEIKTFEETYPDKDKWTRDDKGEYSRLRTNLVGIGNMLDDAIAEYNARSKMVNRSIFKDNLPVNISRAFYTSGALMNGGE